MCVCARDTRVVLSRDTMSGRVTGYTNLEADSYYFENQREALLQLVKPRAEDGPRLAAAKGNLKALLDSTTGRMGVHATKTPLQELAGDETGVRFQPRHMKRSQKLGLNSEIPKTAWIAKTKPGTPFIEAVVWAVTHVQQKMPNDVDLLSKPIIIGIFRDTHQSMNHYHSVGPPRGSQTKNVCLYTSVQGMAITVPPIYSIDVTSSIGDQLVPGQLFLQVQSGYGVPFKAKMLSMSAFERQPVAPDEVWVHRLPSAACGPQHSHLCYCAQCLPYPDGVGRPQLDHITKKAGKANPEVYEVDTGEYIAMPHNFDDHPHRFVLPSGHDLIWRNPPQQLLLRFGRDLSNTTRSIKTNKIRNAVCYPCTDVGPPPVGPPPPPPANPPPA